MPEYRSSLIRILQYQKRIVNSVLIRKDMGLRKPEIWHFLRNGYDLKFLKSV